MLTLHALHAVFKKTFCITSNNTDISLNFLYRPHLWPHIDLMLINDLERSKCKVLTRIHWFSKMCPGIPYFQTSQGTSLVPLRLPFPIGILAGHLIRCCPVWLSIRRGTEDHRPKLFPIQTHSTNDSIEKDYMEFGGKPGPKETD